MFNKTDASAKLYLLIFIMTVFIIGIGIYGIVEMRGMNQNTQTLYADRMLPIKQLTTMRNYYLAGIITTTEQAQNRQLSFKESLKQIEDAQKNITANWQAYLLTYLTPEEESLTKQASLLMSQSNAMIEKLIAALGKEDSHTLDNIINTKLYPAIDPVVVKLNELVKLQIGVGEQVYEKSSEAYDNSFRQFLILILLSLLFAIPFSYFLVRSVKRLIEDLDERNKKIARDEKKYRSIFENVQDVFYQASIDGTLLEVSPSIKSQIGFSPEEVIGTSVSSLYYDWKDRELVLRILKEKAVLKDYEVRLKSSTGEPIFVSLTAKLIPGTNEITDHIDGVFRNITERKKMEEELFERKEQLTLFIEHSPASLAMFDTGMRYIATSQRWLNDYNLGEQQLIGKTHYEIFPEISQEWKDIHQRCLNGAIEKNEEDKFIRSDGREEWIKWEIHPWHKGNGKIGGIIMFTEVITERKKAAELFKLQFENSPDIILIINREFIIESINHSLPGGTPVEELIGINSIENLPVESREAARNAIIKCFETGENQEVEGTLRYGQWARSRFVPIIYDDGTITHIMVISTDITERKNTEDALFKSNEQYSLLFDQMLNGLMVCEVIYDEKGHSIDHRFLLGNPAFEKLTGLSLKEQTGRTSKNFGIGWPPEVLKTLYNVAATGGSIQYERFNETLGKTYETRVFSPRKGQFAHIFTDITEQKEAEEKLRQSEEKHRALIENISDGIVLVDNNLEVIYQSPSVERIVGYTLADRKDQKAIDFIHPDDVQLCIRQYEKSNQSPGVPIQSIYRSRHKLGHYIWIEIFMMNLLHDKSVNAYVVIYRDITERKKSQEIIKQSEANYRQLFDRSPAPMWVVDAETYKFIQVNQASINHYGYSKEEFAQMTVEDISLQKREKYLGTKSDQFSTVYMGMHRHIKKSGEIIDVETSGIPVVLNGKKQLLMVAMDVTEKNLYEQKLTRASIKAQEDERYEIGGELHDNVCQILATSLIYLSMIKKTGILPESQKYFDQTYQYIDQASQEIRNLSHRLAPAFFDNSTLEDAFKTLLSTFNIENNYKINLDFSPEAKGFPLHRDLQLNLYRILQEQLRNILKHAKATTIYVEVTIHKKNLQMSIADNGIGFNLENGTAGIGFANMNRRVQLFSGNLSVDSSVGNGCEIIIEIPL